MDVTIFCCCTARFVSDLVGNPEARFSHDTAHICLPVCSEHLILTMAKRMAEDGYLAAGYQYITVDDCWPEYKRDTDGRLQPDHERFPSGIKNLTDKV